MNFKEIRTKLGLSQVQMAYKLNVSIGTYINWERGVMKPNEENEKKLKEVLGVE